MSKQVTLMTDAIPYQEFAKLIGKSTGAVRRMIDTVLNWLHRWPTSCSTIRRRLSVPNTAS